MEDIDSTVSTEEATLLLHIENYERDSVLKHALRYRQEETFANLHGRTMESNE